MAKKTSSSSSGGSSTISDRSRKSSRSDNETGSRGTSSTTTSPTTSKKKSTTKTARTQKTTTRQKKSTTQRREPSAADKTRAAQILALLEKHYPDAECALHFSNPTELLIATILSAQATDAGVNKATPALFEAFRTPADYAALKSPEELEPWISSIGLYRNKAKAIHAAMQMIVNDFGGEVPNTMEDLIKLRGVARKTANVVLGNAFGKNEGVVVDTHVGRLAQRFGLTTEKDPVKVERDLMALFPRESWTKLSHMLILHGRAVCKARGWTCPEHELCRQYCSNVPDADPST